VADRYYNVPLGGGMVGDVTEGGSDTSAYAAFRVTYTATGNSKVETLKALSAIMDYVTKDVFPSGLPTDEMECGFAAADGLGREAAVEGGQLAAMGDREGQEIGVGDLGRGQHGAGVDMRRGDEADVVGPEDMTRQRAEARDDAGGERGRTGTKDDWPPT
jgi:hypothetical protein